MRGIRVWCSTHRNLIRFFHQAPQKTVYHVFLGRFCSHREQPTSGSTEGGGRRAFSCEPCHGEPGNQGGTHFCVSALINLQIVLKFVNSYYQPQDPDIIDQPFFRIQASVTSLEEKTDKRELSSVTVRREWKLLDKNILSIKKNISLTQNKLQGK